MSFRLMLSLFGYAAAGVVLGRSMTSPKPERTDATPAVTAAKPSTQLLPGPVPASLPPPLLDPSMPQKKVIEVLLECYAAGRTSQALAAFRGIADQSLATAIAREFAAHINGIDPHFVARLALALPTSQETDSIFSNIFSRWQGMDVYESFAFLETLPPASVRPSMLGEGWCLELLPADRVAAYVNQLSPECRGRVKEGVVAQSNQASPWINSRHLYDQINTPHTDYMTRVEASMIAIESPEKVLAMIDDPTQAASRDGLIAGYTITLPGNCRQEALQWNASISDPQRRLEAMNQQLRLWGAEDRAAALSWLGSNEAALALGESERSRWLKTMGEGQR